MRITHVEGSHIGRVNVPGEVNIFTSRYTMQPDPTAFLCRCIEECIYGRFLEVFWRGIIWDYELDMDMFSPKFQNASEEVKSMINKEQKAFDEMSSEIVSLLISQEDYSFLASSTSPRTTPKDKELNCSNILNFFNKSETNPHTLFSSDNPAGTLIFNSNSTENVSVASVSGSEAVEEAFDFTTNSNRTIEIKCCQNGGDD